MPQTGQVWPLGRAEVVWSFLYRDINSDNQRQKRESWEFFGFGLVLGLITYLSWGYESPSTGGS